MTRIITSAVALIVSAACLAGSTPATAQAIKLAFYAPKAFYWPAQGDPPVRIIGFETTRSKIGFVLSNTSGKAVTSVGILTLVVSPPECAPPPEKELRQSPALLDAHIAPHGTAVIFRDDVFTKKVIYDAESFSGSYVQTQSGIFVVHFQDGTTWPTNYNQTIQSEPFDPELVKWAGHKCSGTPPSDIAESEEIVFERQSPQLFDFDAEHSTIPQLHFRCHVEGTTAICQMPSHHN
jgi:hypothetical protein